MREAELNDRSMIAVRYKVVFVGDVSVGKTSIMRRFLSGDFEDTYNQTIGVDFAHKSIEFRENIIKLQMWDSAGQEKFKSLIPSYVKGASLIFIVYDVSRKETFDNLSGWIEFIKDNNFDTSLLILVGNKTDLTREVNTEQGVEIAQKEDMTFFEVSAKSNDNVLTMFLTSLIELPFFQQVELSDKKKLIEELEGNFKIVREQSIYEGVRDFGSLKIENSVEEEKKKKKNCMC